MDELDDMKPSDFDDPNDWWNHMFSRAIERLVEGGVDEPQAPAKAVKVVTDTIDKCAAEHAESMENEGRQYLVNSVEYRTGFAERLRVHWGEPLDLYELIVSAVEYGGTKFSERNLTDATNHSLLLDVLVQMNGQAIRVAREIHTLLAAGFPLGAHSLARSMHEISVRAGVLAKFGRRPEHSDLAERFVLHDRVVNYRDAMIYQRDVGRLNYEPFGEDEMAEMKRRHDDLLDRFGTPYGTPFGWAAGLPRLQNPKRPTFADLETLAELDHFRGIYRWSSHFIHGDSKALRLGRVERGGSSAVLTNATNMMLADPGQHALIGLNRVFVSMVTSADPSRSPTCSYAAPCRSFSTRRTTCSSRASGRSMRRRSGSRQT